MIPKKSGYLGMGIGYDTQKMWVFGYKPYTQYPKKNWVRMYDLIQWCYYNKMDINWKKTEIMFIHNKKNITIPDFIMINENQVKVVSEFKLLGIIIDDKLNFNAYASKIRKALNIRLYSIQKLFQLPIAVKIQFLKTHVLGRNNHKY